MIFQRGQAVRITYAEHTLDGMVLLASPNDVSLMLGFDGALIGPSGGAFIGSMPVLLEDGVYYDLVEGAPVTIEPLRSD